MMVMSWFSEEKTRKGGGGGGGGEGGGLKWRNVWEACCNGL